LVTQLYLGPPDDVELTSPGANRRQVWQRHFLRSYEQFVRIRTNLLDVPGVRFATFASMFPGNDVETARIELGDGAATVSTRIAAIGPQFFEVLGASPWQGRDFAAADFRGAPRSVIVNEPFAQRYFPGRSPLGETLRVLGQSGADAGPWLEIVGVAPDLGLNPGDRARADGIYVPFEPSNFARIAVRTHGDPSALIPAVHRIVSRENARAQIQSAESLAAQMRMAESLFRGLGGGLLAIGGAALLLSAVSLYSLVSFGVTCRTREVGIRLALGATRRRILVAILAREARLVGAGAAGGVLLGLGLHRIVTLLPFDLSPAASSLLVAGVGLMAVVGAGACLVPARRALRIDVADALRYRVRDSDQNRNTRPACALTMIGSKRTGSSPSSRSSTRGGASATLKRSSYSRK